MTVTWTADLLAGHLKDALQAFQAASSKIALTTMAIIAVDLEKDVPEVRWLHCSETDQDTSGSLVFYGAYDTSGNEIVLPDEGDRFYGDVPIMNLDDLTDDWKAYETTYSELGFTVEGVYPDSHWLDIHKIRKDLNEGKLL